MLRVIKEVKPAWIVGENVTGIIGMVLEQVLSDLENAGYNTETFIIPACSIGALHKRDRLWIVAHANGKRWKDEQKENGQLLLTKSGTVRLINKKGLSSNAGLSNMVQFYPTPTAQDAKNLTLPPSQKDRDSIPGMLLKEGITGKLNPEWVEWLMGYPIGWTELKD